MRIAQVSPLYESVPPQLYGGTERVVFNLTEALVRQGHDVTLFASGDSKSSAELDAGPKRALRLDPTVVDPLPHHLLLLEKVVARAREFDVIHFHLDYLSFPLSRRIKTPQLVTLHGRLDLPDLPTIFETFPNYPVVSISNAQRTPLPEANWVGNVYHGLPSDLHKPSYEPGSYFAFLGRISPEKRVDRAIEIAKACKVPLKIAAKISDADRAYFNEVIEPLLDHELVEFIGEINEAQKGPFLRNAKALLFPIDWPEPFGLVMIEAMACGTPVLAFDQGSVPEVMVDGITGRVVRSMPEAIEAAKNIDEINRRGVREVFNKRFTSDRMSSDYTYIYEELMREKFRSARGRTKGMRRSRAHRSRAA